MKTERIQLTGHDGRSLPSVLWLPEQPPKAILQITHGMTEHIGRYPPLAEHLTAQGIAVAGYDLRGHGTNGSDPDCASFGEGGWEASLEDMDRFRGYLSERFPTVPHFMLGFSLGSFLLREYLTRYPQTNIAGAAILGTGHQPSAVLTVIMAIVKTQFKKAGPDGTTSLVKQLSFETYNKKFAPNRTVADWLCADEAELDAYIADPLCRESISATLFHSLLGAMKRTGAKDTYRSWSKQLPILLLSGQDDPVGDFGKGVTAVKQAMDKAGLTHVELRLFPHARHDLLHETSSGCAEQVRTILASWILTHI